MSISGRLLKISPKSCESASTGALEYEKREAFKLLDDLRDRVRKGDLMSLAVAYHNYDGSYGTAFSIPTHHAAILGAMKVLEGRIVSIIEEGE